LVGAATSSERPTPRRLGAEVSDELERLCARALSLLPEDRFANAGELLGAFDALPCVTQPRARGEASEDATSAAQALPPAAAEQDTGAFLEGRGVELSTPGAMLSPPRTAVPEIRTERALPLEHAFGATPWGAASPPRSAPRPSPAPSRMRWLLPVIAASAAVVLLAPVLAYLAARSGVGSVSVDTSKSASPGVVSGMVDELQEALMLLPRPASGAWLATVVDIGANDLSVRMRDPNGSNLQRRYHVVRGDDGRLSLEPRQMIDARRDVGECYFEIRADEQEVARRICADVLATFPHVQIRSLHKRCVEHSGVRWTAVVYTSGEPDSERSLTYTEDGRPR
jgi:hypothetical protein